MKEYTEMTIKEAKGKKESQIIMNLDSYVWKSSWEEIN